MGTGLRDSLMDKSLLKENIKMILGRDLEKSIIHMENCYGKESFLMIK